MDKSSRKILCAMVDENGFPKLFNVGDETEALAKKLNINYMSFKLNIVYLAKIGFINIIKYEGTDAHAAYILTHEGVAWKYFRWREILRYLEDKWIDFFSLLLSTIALLISISGRLL